MNRSVPWQHLARHGGQVARRSEIMFARGEVGRAAAHGFGLGLAIALTICKRQGTTLTAGRSPLGGARISFAFDRAAPRA